MDLACRSRSVGVVPAIAALGGAGWLLSFILLPAALAARIFWVAWR